MSEKVLGIIRLSRVTFTRSIVVEDLFFTSNRVIVARAFTGAPWYAPAGIILAKDLYIYYKVKKEKGHPELRLDDVLKADKNNFVIPKSEITKVELWKFVRAIHINITTKKKKYKWTAVGLIPEKKDVKLEDYENMLRQAFPEKLIVKK